MADQHSLTVQLIEVPFGLPAGVLLGDVHPHLLHLRDEQLRVIAVRAPYVLLASADCHGLHTSVVETGTAGAPQCFQGGLPDQPVLADGAGGAGAGGGPVCLHLPDHLQSPSQIRQVELEVAGAGTFSCDQAPCS